MLANGSGKTENVNGNFFKHRNINEFIIRTETKEM